MQRGREDRQDQREAIRNVPGGRGKVLIEEVTGAQEIADDLPIDTLSALMESS